MWTRVVRFVATGYDAEPPIAEIHIGQVVFADDEPTPHPTVVISVEARAVECNSPVPVNAQTLASGGGSENVYTVVKFPAPSQQGVEIRDNLGMSEQVTKRFAPRLRPRQHTVVMPEWSEFSIKWRSLQVALVMRCPFISIHINGLVEGGNFGSREKIFDHQKALKIEEVLLSLAHGDKFYVFVHGDDLLDL